MNEEDLAQWIEERDRLKAELAEDREVMAAGDADCRRLGAELTLARAVVEAARNGPSSGVVSNRIEAYDRHTKASAPPEGSDEKANDPDHDRYTAELYDADRDAKPSSVGGVLGAAVDSAIPPSVKPQPSGAGGFNYPCVKCGKLRTKAEGGTVFTVCDECWDECHGAQRISGGTLPEPSGTAEGATKWGIYDRNRRIWWPRAFFSQEEAQAHYNRCHQLGDDGYPRPLPAGPHPPPMARAIAEGPLQPVGAARTGGFVGCPPHVRCDLCGTSGEPEPSVTIADALPGCKVCRCCGANIPVRDDRCRECWADEDDWQTAEKIASLESRLRETTEKLRGAEREAVFQATRSRDAHDKIAKLERDLGDRTVERDQAVARAGELEARLTDALNCIDLGAPICIQTDRVKARGRRALGKAV